MTDSGRVADACDMTFDHPVESVAKNVQSRDRARELVTTVTAWLSTAVDGNRVFRAKSDRKRIESSAPTRGHGFHAIRGSASHYSI
jgi:hypothetical protein